MVRIVVARNDPPGVTRVEVPAYTIEQVSRLMNQHPQTVKRWIRTGVLGSILLEGRRLIPRDALLARLMEEIHENPIWDQVEAVLVRNGVTDEAVAPLVDAASSLLDFHTRLCNEWLAYQGDTDSAEKVLALLPSEVEGGPDMARGQAH